MKRYEMDVRIYYEDTDAGGVVYHTNHIKYMERARTEFLNSLGKQSLAQYHGRGMFFVVTHVDIKYRHPARLGDLLRVTAELSEVRSASMSFRQELRRGDTLIAEATISIALTDFHKVIRLPQEFRAALAQ